MLIALVNSKKKVIKSKIYNINTTKSFMLLVSSFNNKGFLEVLLNNAIAFTLQATTTLFTLLVITTTITLQANTISFTLLATATSFILLAVVTLLLATAMFV